MSETERSTYVNNEKKASHETDRLALGLDLGSVSLNSIVLTEAGEIVEDRYTRTKGLPMETTLSVLQDLLDRYPAGAFKTVGITGSGGKMLAGLVGGHFVNEIISQAKAMERLHPEVRSIIEIGGEDSKLILVEYDKDLGATVIKDFAMNTICAAGTGSFLDQQASRLEVSIEEFGEMALRSENPPRIAGRCSVFAKTDMIHLQQEATPDYDIVAGLCFAMARNFKSNIAKGKQFTRPISFQGGVAANKGMVRAFEEVLELGKGELIVPVHFASMGAIGAALTAVANGSELEAPLSLKNLEHHVNEHAVLDEGLEKLDLDEARRYKYHKMKTVHKTVDHTRKTKAYLGVDVGSLSTNVVVIDQERRVLARRYLMTAGRPIEAVRRGLEEVGAEVGDFVEICGVCTTGSGRYLTGEFVGADIVRNEITCQARGAVSIDPTVDTVFEIGGQDSKYISLENGAVVDFEMNKVCAAGTGSFLEEQAEKLGINIKEEFGEIALGAPNPVRLGERCTVFMESDLLHHQQKGATRDNLVGGLSYSIVYNYLNKVVAGKRVGNNIFFQGGPAANDGVVAAFERVTGRKITVPEHHDVTGAIGAAIIALENDRGEKSKFKGFDLSRKKYEITSFECGDCPNMCEIKKVVVEGERPIYYGSRCEKYEVDKKKKSKAKEIPDLFAERERFLAKLYVEPGRQVKADSRKIGIPRMLLFHEIFPLWHAFFRNLGFEIVLSDKTNKRIIHSGIESVPAETCFPVKVAHGHIENLMAKSIDYIFLPSVINLRNRNPYIEQSFACPYAQTIPYISAAAFDFKKHGIKTLMPYVYLARGDNEIVRTLKEMGAELGKSEKQIRRAVEAGLKAQEMFYDACGKRGREVLEGLGQDDRAFVIVSRPYNGCDNGVNLELPKKLRELGALPMPMDFLALDTVNLSEEWENMYWRYGQKIMSAAEIIRKDKRLFAIYITNFGCGPDSFITHFFREAMRGKPYLQIEIDEHSADVGAITRCEAFLDSIDHARVKEVHEEVVVVDDSDRLDTRSGGTDRKLYIPSMAPHAYAFAAAFTHSGVPAEVLPESDGKTVEYGRVYTSGKECYPCIVTTGDMVKKVKEPDFDPKRSAFFMPSGTGPCRFGQYHRLQRLVLKELGHEDVPIIAPNQGREFYNEIGKVAKGFDRLAWRGLLAVDFLERLTRERRPYEKVKGTFDKVFWESVDAVSKAIVGGEDIFDTLERCKAQMLAVEIEPDDGKPLIGIVGEVFVRCNRFSNDNIVVEVERLGGEAWLPPFTEWILYTNFTRKRSNLKNKDYKGYLTTVLKDWIQKKDEHTMKEIFRDAVKKIDEPTTEEVLALAQPYVHDSFEGEAGLSIGKSIDFINHGACGIINVMPFTCMPGTIVTGVMKRARPDLDNIPFLTMAYDGLEQTNTLTRLEAFMHQASQYNLSRGRRTAAGHARSRVVQARG